MVLSEASKKKTNDPLELLLNGSFTYTLYKKGRGYERRIKRKTAYFNKNHPAHKEAYEFIEKAREKLKKTGVRYPPPGNPKEAAQARLDKARKEYWERQKSK